MNVLNIATKCDGGGAGKATIRLHEALKSIGVSSKMLVLYKPDWITQEGIFQLKNKFNLACRLKVGFLSKFARYGLIDFEKKDSDDSYFFSNDRSIYKVSSDPLITEADIVTLRWISGMVDYADFFSNVNKPIVWRLSDMNPMTGGCHLPGTCDKYRTGCGACPQLGSTNPNDLSRRVYKRKEKYYKGHRIYIVSPSRSFAEFIKQSRLFNGMYLEVIPSGISTTSFTPRDRTFSRSLLGLPQDKIIVLFGSAYKSKQKGFKYLVEALRFLRTKNDMSKIVLALCGDIANEDTKDLGIPFINLGYITDETLMSCVYSAADLFVMPSLEESFGQMCLEALSCATTVIGFNVGGLPEMIIPGETGLLAQTGDIRDLAHKIAWVIENPEKCLAIRNNARKHIEKKYSLETEARLYLALYKRILKTEK